MATRRKLQAAVVLLGLQSALYLFSGIGHLTAGGAYAEYGHMFIMCGIYAFIAYSLLNTKNQQILWLAYFFTGLAVGRFVIFGGLIALLNPAAITLSEHILPTAFVVLFGLIPLVLLLQKDVRAQFHKI